jgi:hypothetical protein
MQVNTYLLKTFFQKKVPVLVSFSCGDEFQFNLFFNLLYLLYIFLVFYSPFDFFLWYWGFNSRVLGLLGILALPL